MVEFLDRSHFNYLARKYKGNRYVKLFLCWNQLLTLMFGQLNNRESLHSLTIAFKASGAKQHRLRLGHEPIPPPQHIISIQN